MFLPAKEFAFLIQVSVIGCFDKLNYGGIPL